MGIRIAILTLYYKNSNYGGVLQAYALQKTLSKFGSEAKQISYKLESGYKKRNIIYRVIRAIYRKFMSLFNLKWYLKCAKHEKQIYGFAERIPHTKVVDVNSINNLSYDFDMFVCGSDQIWNPIGWQPTLFLDFVPEDKYITSYAASVARDNLDNKELDFMKKYLYNFKSVSVREEKTAEILNRYFDAKHIDVMPDPTMLLTEEEWSEVVAHRLEEDSYIFAYFLGNDFKQRDQAIKYAKKRNLKIIFIPYLRKDMYLWDISHMMYMKEGIGVPEFLSLIKYAEEVITDSYHGAVFSAIFEKQMWILTRFKKNDANSMNSRLDTLVHELGMESRLISEFNNGQISDDIEAKNITKHLELLRKKGISYLKHHVEESNKCLKNY